MDKRVGFGPAPVPEGLKSLGKVFEELKWLHETMAFLERMPSCQMRSTLREDLSKRMDNPNHLLYCDILNRLENADNMNSQLKSELDVVKSYLVDVEDSLIEDLHILPRLEDHLRQVRRKHLLKLRLLMFSFGALAGLILPRIIQTLLS